MPTHLHAAHAWLPGGFARDVQFVAGAPGPSALASVRADATRDAAATSVQIVVPGMPNLHSHAFQRAMAGLAERRAPQQAEDSFWSWREVMYAFAGRIGPEDLRAIAAQLYVEMLEAGYTQVCEFHYLHHQPDGRPYDDPAAMSLALVEAAREAGIGLTLLPTLYMTGGFDGRRLSDRQRRFSHDVDAYLRLLERLRALDEPALNVGIALHSLRAVPADAMRAVLDAIDAIPAHRRQRAVERMPVHIHIAEQIGEVQDCLAIRNARPVEWLLDHAPVDARWCLVHATHLSEAETRRLAASGAVAGLCPTTEANLGDGLFPLRTYLDEGGALGIGSDSHISVSPVEELRWLEYGQRLVTRHRNISASAAQPSSGETLFAHALAGGAKAAGGALAALAPGHRADIVVLDDASPLLAGRSPQQLVDTWLFAGNANLVRDVMVGGEWVVREHRHRDAERIARRYRGVVERLARA
ncbi:formimidoylglutamate deiminase [Dokdonella fugitiva]|uniref:Formimidoylglutamate deiminase n=1 Tax=Dokdonella fugitiva TaxID=328517 RepID=A0A4R2HXQ2_9GAMM|nr:formimidoylglutamate deiminase [Dokdonella fugitiva]TCO34845.1 formimidoylglutamate deiminase [Dokdonella fugitiva]